MLIRYPGGKSRYAKHLIDLIQRANGSSYFEPFFGSGSVGFEFLKRESIPCLLSDVDISLISLWKTVKNNPEFLCKRILEYTPSVESFYKFKELDGQDGEEAGFRKLVLHQISYSGLGAKAGGPIGGAYQKSKYDVGCRWSPETLYKNIQKANVLLNKQNVRIECTDYLAALEQASAESIVYLDPPYFHQGEGLYVNGFAGTHAQLASFLKTSKFKFVLSYDNCKEILDLYGWANTQNLNVCYTLASQENNNQKELIITNW